MVNRQILLENAKIKIIEVKPTIPDAHARFSAISREYEYVILNRSAPPALDDGRVWHQRVDLNIQKCGPYQKMFLLISLFYMVSTRFFLLH